MSEFGRLLAEYRAAHGISQYRLARWMDCNHGYVSRIESGKRHPSRKFTELLIDVLDLPPRDANVFRMSAGYAPVYTKGVRYGALPAL